MTPDEHGKAWAEWWEDAAKAAKLEELHAAESKAEAAFLRGAEVSLSRWIQQAGPFGPPKVILPRGEWIALLQTFRDVLAIAREYHDGAEDLVG